MHVTNDAMRQTKRAVMLAAVLSGCAVACGAATVVFAVWALELIATHATVSALGPLAIAIVLAVGCISIVDLSIDRTLLRAGLWIDHVLEPMLLRAGLAETSTPGALLDSNRALGELRDFIVSRSLRTTLMLPWLLVGTALLAMCEPRVGGLTLAVALTALGMAAVGAALARPSFSTQIAAARVVRRGVVTVATNSESLVGLALATHACEVESASNRTWIAAAFAHGRRLTLAGVAGRALLVIGEIAVVAVTAHLMLAGQISGLAGLMLVTLSLAMLAPLFELPTHLLRLEAARAAWRLLKDVSLSEPAHKLFATRPDSDGPTDARASQLLELRDVDFTYPRSMRAAVSGINLVVEPGSAIVLDGAPGAGKSTVAALLAGGLSPAAGLAMLGHTTVRRRQGTTSRPAIGWLMQEPILMSGTVADNITRFTSSTIDDAIETARRAGVFGVLATLPDGFATHVGEDGRSLSMRQRRAVALARALHGTPSFVILDEPETLADEAVVADLADTLAELVARGTGLVLVTRHPMLTALAKRHLLIADGKLTVTATSAAVWHPSAANDAVANADLSGPPSASSFAMVG